MKKTLIIIAAVFATNSLLAQSYAPAKDSIVEQINIFERLMRQNENGHIVIHQNTDVTNLVKWHSVRNASKKLTGFRVRIFFDSGQRARQISENVARNFLYTNPNVAVYRVYENIYYKVTVGDFRTKSDAMRFLRSIKEDYPSAFIIKENINYPTL